MMITGLISIVGIYGLAVILVHLLCRKQYGAEQPLHWIIVSKNNQMRMEWYLRSMPFFAWVKGRNWKLTIVDLGSSDDTLAIVNMFAVESHGHIRVIRSISDQTLRQFLNSHAGDHCMIVNLCSDDDLKPIPLF